MEKFYNTKQKSIILETLKKFKDNNYTAEEISNLLINEGFSVSRATLFRALDSFSKKGSVKKLFLNNNEGARYQYVEGECMEEDHIHLICTNCGKLIHADIDSVKRVDNEVLRKYGFNISEEKTMLYGLCSKCKEEQNEEK